MKLSAGLLLAAAPIFLLGGCVAYAPSEACPGFKPAHEVTDQVMRAFNEGFAVSGEAAYPAGWHHSVWVERRVPICKRTEAHVLAFGAHHRADGTEISRFERRYRIALVDGRWQRTGSTPGEP